MDRYTGDHPVLYAAKGVGDDVAAIAPPVVAPQAATVGEQLLTLTAIWERGVLLAADEAQQVVAREAKHTAGPVAPAVGWLDDWSMGATG